jgi:hypothetical protein
MNENKAIFNVNVNGPSFGDGIWGTVTGSFYSKNSYEKSVRKTENKFTV